MQAYLGLGANLGDRLANMQRAVDELGKEVGKVIAASSVYECDPMYDEKMPRFLNAVVVAETELAPAELLKRIKEIEARVGRGKGEGGRESARKIDIDILFCGAEMIEVEGLVVPHPRMLERLFVLMPLGELNPEIEVNGKKVLALAKKLRKERPDYRICRTKFKLKW